MSFGLTEQRADRSFNNLAVRSTLTATRGVFSNLEAPNSTSADQLGYINGDTGSVARTIASKLRENVSVLDFGADPTGVNDSSPAFRLAIKSNRNVLVPPGEYLFSTVEPAKCCALNPACVTVENATNFGLKIVGATLRASDSLGSLATPITTLMFYVCQNFEVDGGTYIGTKAGLDANDENTAFAFLSCVSFEVSNINIASGYGGNVGCGIVGDWWVDGLFQNISMSGVGIMFDVAFLQNVVLSNVNGFGAGFDGSTATPGEKGISIIHDLPNIDNNFTGVTFSNTNHVSIIGCSMTNFKTGAAISAGNNISFTNCLFQNNPGFDSAKGIGLYIFYTNGGIFSSVGIPVSNMTVTACQFVNNGVEVAGGGILLDAASSAGVDKISNITVCNCVFDNNREQGIAVNGTTNLQRIIAIGNTYSGANQLYGIAPNLLPLINAINTDSANFATTVEFQNPLNVKNNTAVAWYNSLGSATPIINVSASNETILRPASALAPISLQSFGGTSGFQLFPNVDTNNPVFVMVGGALQKVTAGAADSGGAGFRQLLVPN